VRAGYAVVLANNLSPSTLLIAANRGEPNPAVDYMPADSWGFVVDGLRHRAKTRNMTLDELGSVLVSFWADSRVPPIGLSVPLGSETAQRMTFGLRYLSFHDLLNEARTGEAR
jgi:hypothetical protein